MRPWIVAALAAALGIGGAFGWIIRGEPKEIVRIVEKPVRVTVAAPPRSRALLFPNYPKPPFELPPPDTSPGGEIGGTAMPPVMIGDLPRLPTASPDASMGPLTPDVPNTPVADLRADEALARRIVLQSGGDVLSSADAKDASGKVGRALVAETPPGGRNGLREALRAALGDRIVLSDGGTVDGSSPAIQKAQGDLEAARKARDKARLDFLPEAPALRQMEDEYARVEKALVELRKTAARARLNILIRPVLSS